MMREYKPWSNNSTLFAQEYTGQGCLASCMRTISAQGGEGSGYEDAEG
jgi:hypothetical protein